MKELRLIMMILGAILLGTAIAFYAQQIANKQSAAAYSYTTVCRMQAGLAPSLENGGKELSCRESSYGIWSGVLIVLGLVLLVGAHFVYSAPKAPQLKTTRRLPCPVCGKPIPYSAEACWSCKAIITAKDRKGHYCQQHSPLAVKEPDANDPQKQSIPAASKPLTVRTIWLTCIGFLAVFCIVVVVMIVQRLHTHKPNNELIASGEPKKEAAELSQQVEAVKVEQKNADDNAKNETTEKARHKEYTREEFRKLDLSAIVYAQPETIRDDMKGIIKTVENLEEGTQYILYQGNRRIGPTSGVTYEKKYSRVYVWSLVGELILAAGRYSYDHVHSFYNEKYHYPTNVAPFSDDFSNDLLYDILADAKIRNSVPSKTAVDFIKKVEAAQTAKNAEQAKAMEEAKELHSRILSKAEDEAVHVKADSPDEKERWAQIRAERAKATAEAAKNDLDEKMLPEKPKKAESTAPTKDIVLTIRDGEQPKKPAPPIAATPTAPQPQKPNVKVITYTMKDGSVLRVLNSVEGGDSYVVKTEDGKFLTIKKTDVEEIKNED